MSLIGNTINFVCSAAHPNIVLDSISTTGFLNFGLTMVLQGNIGDSITNVNIEFSEDGMQWYTLRTNIFSTPLLPGQFKHFEFQNVVYSMRFVATATGSPTVNVYLDAVS